MSCLSDRYENKICNINSKEIIWKKYEAFRWWWSFSFIEYPIDNYAEE